MEEAEEELWKQTEVVVVVEEAVAEAGEEEVESFSAAAVLLCSPWNHLMKMTVSAVV